MSLPGAGETNSAALCATVRILSITIAPGVLIQFGLSSQPTNVISMYIGPASAVIACLRCHLRTQCFVQVVILISEEAVIDFISLEIKLAGVSYYLHRNKVKGEGTN